MRIEESGLDVASVRSRFPALRRADRTGAPFVFADAPGGTQVPGSVIEAMTSYLERSNANAGGAFLTSGETDAVIAEARKAGADLLGCDQDEVAFGANMTSLAFSLSRALGRDLGPDDEIVVTVLDHDANVAPWLALRDDTGAGVRWVDVETPDCHLNLDSLDACLGPKTRIVTFTLASNAVGTITAAREVAARAHAAGALVVADAVHLAQHRLVDVRALSVDVLFCSPYKIFGPHLGVMFARRDLLESLTPYKVRPSSNDVPARVETGTLSHEALAGFAASVEYVARLGERSGSMPVASRRDGIVAGFEAIADHETALSKRFLSGLTGLSQARLWGIGEGERAGERTPTFAVRLDGYSPRDLATELGARGIFVWDGNYYALEIMKRLGLEDSGGAVRIGFCHYNTLEEVDRVLAELEELSGSV